MSSDLLKIGIARGIRKEALVPAFEAAVLGGFTSLEITMNTDGADGLIRLARNHFQSGAQIGAGTVRTLDDLYRALDAGAQFIVMPVTDLDILAYCKSREIPVYPGALTPTEIETAWRAGAAMVKVFPVDAMGGASYIRNVKGPLDDVKLLACSGVTPENLSDYIKAGADGIAIGTQLFNKQWLEEKSWDKITQTARKFEI